MRERSAAVFTHLGDSIRLCLLAGALVAAFSKPMDNLAASAMGLLGEHGCFWVWTVILLSFGMPALWFPVRFISVVESIRYLPFHAGLVSKVLMGIGFYVLTRWLMHVLVQTPMVSLCSILLLLAFCLSVLIPAWILARGFLALKRWLITSQGGETKAGDWWLDDRPIDTKRESRFSQIAQVATRISDRLMLDRSGANYSFPSMALIGAYGAGKTSICNMVRDLQDRRRNGGEPIPRVLFRRFEGWQFLSPEATVRDFLEQVTRAILNSIDAPELWRLPKKYVDSLGAVPHPGIKSVVAWLGTSESPQEVASAIGAVLVRTDTRLVVFVDDFDRMEDDSLGAERAVARTLNQIQNLPNLQYVLALGPRIIWGERPGEYRSSTDLLKLTRFQEIVPELDAETVLREIRELRDAALAGEDCWYPWNRVGAETDDPLYYNPISRYIGVSQRLADILGGLLRTPRVFKTVLRETTTAWNNGLRGELNWYDLILLNAIKAACPSVFEWVARDLSTFIGYPGFHRRVDTQDGALLKAEANELKVKTERTVGRADAGLAELVVSALEYLFPTFAARISARADPIEPPAWDQRISAYSLLGPASIERFFAGRVPSDDVPDQFILRFIHKTNREPLDKEAFREQFLLSGEASRKRMNKLVHFAGLLSQAPALGISGGILDWASSLEHPQDQMDNYPQDVLGLVTALLKNCGDPQYEPGGRPVEPNPTEAWLTERIRLCTPETAVLTILLVHQVLRVLIFSAETEPRWRKELAQALYRQFVEDNKPFRGAVHQSRYSLLWLLQGMSAHDQYEGFRGRMTERVLAEATADTTGLLKSRLIHALVYDSHAAVSGEAPLESYTFGVKQDDNARLFDMDAVIATVRTWDPTLFEDEVSCRAFLYFMDSYALSSQ